MRLRFSRSSVLLLAAICFSGCADKDAETMTCQQFYEAGPGGLWAETSDKQKNVIETLLHEHGWPTGTNVSAAALDLEQFCGLSLGAPGSNTANLRIADMPAWDQQ